MPVGMTTTAVALPLAEATRLLEEGYYQVSSAHRMLAKLPEGKTGRMALYEAAKHERTDAWQWAFSMGEPSAADQYLRVYANSIIVSPAVFAAFKRLGGRTARG